MIICGCGIPIRVSFWYPKSVKCGNCGTCWDRDPDNSYKERDSSLGDEVSEVTPSSAHPIISDDK